MKKSFICKGGPLDKQSFLVSVTKNLKQNNSILTIPVVTVGKISGTKEETMKVPMKTHMCKYKACKVNGTLTLKYKGED